MDAYVLPPGYMEDLNKMTDTRGSIFTPMETPPVPIRMLPVILSLLIPTAGWPWWAIAAQGMFAAIGATLVSTNLAIKWLFIGICFDVLTGITRSLRMDDRFPISKLISDVLVRFGVLYLSVLLSKEAALQFAYNGFTTNPGEFLAIFFLTIVWASAGKNMGELGMPWPKSIMFLLDKVHSSLDDVDLSGKVISAITAFSSKQVGNTQIVSKSETVVTEKPAADEKTT